MNHECYVKVIVEQLMDVLWEGKEISQQLFRLNFMCSQSFLNFLGQSYPNYGKSLTDQSNVL